MWTERRLRDFKDSNSSLSTSQAQGLVHTAFDGVCLECLGLDRKLMVQVHSSQSYTKRVAAAAF